MAVSLMRIANEIRHLGSGPRTGLGELKLPDDGLSSSIMPGKRNATQAEAMVQVVHRIVGNDATVEIANASGLFELNVAKPVLIHAVLDSIDLLTAALPGFGRFVKGVTPDRKRMAENVEMSLMLATALTPELGYDRVAELTREADAEAISLREAVDRSKLLPPGRFDMLVQPARMAAGGIQEGGD
jgi:fumarate hydratase class II